MVSLPRKQYVPRDDTLNEYHLISFDPGGTIGWAHLVLDCRAFSRPEHKALAWLKSWDCGEFTGSEEAQCEAASSLIWQAIGKIQRNRVDVIGEDFELTQLIGGKNLLSPVRINAVLAWECRKYGLGYHLQRRNLRTRITKERLNLFGFQGRWTTTGKGKDAFAAMQHAIVRLQSTKAVSRTRPWKLSDGISSNALWDCACYEREPCDLIHPLD